MSIAVRERPINSRRVLFMGDGRAGNISALSTIAQQMGDRGYEIYFAANSHYRDEIESNGFNFIPVGTSSISPEQEVYPDPWEIGIQKPEILGTIKANLYDASAAVIKQFPNIKNPGFDAVVHDHQTIAGASIANLYGRPNFPTFDSPHNFCYYAGKMPKLDDSAGIALIRKLPTPLLRWMALTWVRVGRDEELLKLINTHRVEIGTHQVGDYYEQVLLSGKAQIGLFPAWYAQKGTSWQAKRIPSWGRNFRQFNFPDSPDAGPENEVIRDCIRGWGKGYAPIIWLSDDTDPNPDKQLEFAQLAVGPERPIILTGKAYPEEGSFRGKRVLAIGQPELSGLLGQGILCVNNGGMKECVETLRAERAQLMIPRRGSQHDTAERFAARGLGLVLPFKDANPQNCAALIKTILGDGNMSTNIAAYARRLGADKSAGDIGRFIDSQISECCVAPR